MPKIIVVISVDWEGRSLLDENLSVMQDFRNKHRSVPMQHFLNAAYYTKPEADIEATTRKIRSVLLPEDDHGLHLHAWKSLFEAAGVKARVEPTLSHKVAATMAPDDLSYYEFETGYDVPVHYYRTDELTDVIGKSISILQNNGFDRAKSFRAGAWMAGENVLEALVRNGISIDCSGMNRRFIQAKFAAEPIDIWGAELWPDIHDTSQPYQVATPAGNLWEFPNNGSLADYASTEDMMSIFQNNIASIGGRDIYISIGFHQETARKYLAKIDAVIKEIERLAVDLNYQVVYSGKPQDYLGSPDSQKIISSQKKFIN